MGAVGSLLLAAGGTVLLIAVAHLLKFRADGRFGSVAEAVTRSGLTAEATAPGALSLDQTVALVLLQSNRLTLIEAVGDRAVSRQLAPGEVQLCTGGVAIIAAGGLGRPSRMVRFEPDALGAVLEDGVLAPRLDALQPPAAS
jgi:hypothetical protein